MVEYDFDVYNPRPQNAHQMMLRHDMQLIQDDSTMIRRFQGVTGTLSWKIDMISKYMSTLSRSQIISQWSVQTVAIKRLWTAIRLI